MTPIRPAPTPPAARTRRALGVAALALAALASACTGTGTGTDAVPAAVPAVDSTLLATPPPLQDEDQVDLTVYFRSGQGVASRLEPVVREVPVSDDLPRQALELLVAGPVEGEDKLDPVLPASTRVLDLTVEGGTARVRLSADVVRDAKAVGPTPTNEVLALAALANTLTEFPSIDEVALEVDGAQRSDGFWGGWGLPDVLVRDESLVGSTSGEQEGVVDLGRFSTEPQEIGSTSAEVARVTGIRVRDRITHTRFIIELADAETGEPSAMVPPVRVRRANDDISLLLTEIVALDGGGDEALRLEADPAHFTAVRHELDELNATLRLVLTPTEPRAWWLHTMANPTRVVLDVQK